MLLQIARAAAALLLLLVPSLLATCATADTPDWYVMGPIPHWLTPSTNCVRKPREVGSMSSEALPCSPDRPLDGCCPAGPGTCVGYDDPEGVYHPAFMCAPSYGLACCSRTRAGAPAGGSSAGAPAADLDWLDEALGGATGGK